MSRSEKTTHIVKRKKKVGKKPPGKNDKVARLGKKDKGETAGTKSEFNREIPQSPRLCKSTSSMELMLDTVCKRKFPDSRTTAKLTETAR